MRIILYDAVSLFSVLLISTNYIFTHLRVGDHTATLSQSNSWIRVSQPIILNPLLNLVSPWLEHLIGGYRHLARPSSVQLD